MNASEAHKMTDQELREETQRLRRELYNLKSQAVTQKLENPKAPINIRRDIARLLTEQKQRSIQSKKA